MPMINQFLWVIFPYVCMVVFVVGHIFRYRYDQFGWTAKSSEFIEKKQLMIGSLLFHLGIIPVFMGHVSGLGIPKSWTQGLELVIICTIWERFGVEDFLELLPLQVCLS